MNLVKFFTVCAFGLAIIACSDSSNNQPASTAESSTPAAQAPALPPAHPPMPQNMQQGVTQGQQQLSPAQQAAIAAAQNLPREGTVLEMMHASGYTYMNVDVGDNNSLWIAASMMRVKPEQKIKWSDAAVMNNFQSKSLHRTFDRIMFVSNAEVIE